MILKTDFAKVVTVLHLKKITENNGFNPVIFKVQEVEKAENFKLSHNNFVTILRNFKEYL